MTPMTNDNPLLKFSAEAATKYIVFWLVSAEKFAIHLSNRFNEMDEAARSNLFAAPTILKDLRVVVCRFRLTIEYMRGEKGEDWDDSRLCQHITTSSQLQNGNNRVLQRLSALYNRCQPASSTTTAQPAATAAQFSEDDIMAICQRIGESAPPPRTRELRTGTVPQPITGKRKQREAVEYDPTPYLRRCTVAEWKRVSEKGQKAREPRKEVDTTDVEEGLKGMSVKED